jgi:hypothetical protein
MRRTYKNKMKRRGGAATVMPLKYFDNNAQTPSAGQGVDLLKATAPMSVRPRIGGRRRKTKGGFVPTVMDGFVAAASKYIVPIALFAGYKLMTKKGKRGSRRATRRR